MDDLFDLVEEDRKTVEFIRAYLPQEAKEAFTEDDLYYIHDVLIDYFAKSGILDQEPDEDGCIEIDTEQVAKEVLQQSAKDQMGPFNLEYVTWVVEGELEYGE